MANYNFNRSIVINTFWSFIGRFGSIIISLVTNIILVRLLTPQEFGRVSIVLFFTIIASVLAESGLSGALVREENTTEEDYSTVFIFNIFISIILMISLILLSVPIANYYDDEDLGKLLKLSSLVILFNSLSITQSVQLIKQLRFKEKSSYELVSYLIAACISIFLAINGFGETALIILEISKSILLAFLLWYFVGPITTFRFSAPSFIKVYKFGINTTIASLINQAFDNSYQLIFAKYFSIEHSGYFYQAKKLQGLPVGIIQGSVLNVIFSALSKLQNDHYLFEKLYNNIVKVFTSILAFVCIIIFLYSQLIINFMYGEQWSTSAIYLKVLIVAAFFYLQELINSLIFKVFDRTDLILKLEVIKKVILSVTIIYGIIKHDIIYLLYGFVASSIISFFLNYHYARKIYRTSYWNELQIILKISLISLIIVTVYDYIFKAYHISELSKLWFFPLIVISYFTLLLLFKILSFKHDLKTLIGLIR